MTTRKKTGSDRGGKKASKKVELSLDDLDRVVGGMASSLIPEEQAANAMAAAVDAAISADLANAIPEDFDPNAWNEGLSRFASAASAEDVEALTSAEISRLGTNVADLSAAAVGAFSAIQVDALTAAQVNALGTKVVALSSVQEAPPAQVLLKSFDVIGSDSYGAFGGDVGSLQSTPVIDASTYNGSLSAVYLEEVPRVGAAGYHTLCFKAGLTYTIDTLGTDFDTTLALFDGSGNFIENMVNDDVDEDNLATLTFTVPAGGEGLYYLGLS